jgi:hypothetical protein
VAERLEKETDANARRALILCLGEMGAERLPETVRAALAHQLGALYRGDPDAGVHGAAEWALGWWGLAAEVERARAALAGRETKPDCFWRVNGQRQDLALVPGTIQFIMGSPPVERDREGGASGLMEMLHPRVINHSYWIGQHEVTIE